MIHAVKMPDNTVKVDLLGSYADINFEIQVLEGTIRDYKKFIKEDYKRTIKELNKEE